MAQIRVFVLPGGKIQIFGDTGTEAEASEATRAVLAQLQAAGIQLSDIGDIEFHRTSGDHVHVVNEVQHENRQ